MAWCINPPDEAAYMESNKGVVMNRKRFRLPVLPMLMALLCAGGAARSAFGMNAIISDGGEFFSAEAEAKANEAVASLRKKFRKDLIIETFASAPDSAKDLAEARKSEFFGKWAAEREKALAADGVYVLICRQPAYIMVGESPSIQKLGFTLAERNKLRDQLLTGFREKKYDAALLEAVAYVGSALEQAAPSLNRKPSAAPPVTAAPPAAPASSVFGIVIVFVCVLLGILVMRAIFGALRGGNSPGGYGGGYGGGGGGFLSSMLGGIGGAMLGSYIYDKMTDHSAPGDTHAASPSAGTSAPSDTDAVSDGTDFDNSGGSFDGGDSGGGFDGGGSFE
jgi:uncharacterized protein